MVLLHNTDGSIDLYNRMYVPLRGIWAGEAQPYTPQSPCQQYQQNQALYNRPPHRKSLQCPPSVSGVV